MVLFTCIWYPRYVEEWKARWKGGDPDFLCISNTCESTAYRISRKN